MRLRYYSSLGKNERLLNLGWTLTRKDLTRRRNADEVSIRWKVRGDSQPAVRARSNWRPAPLGERAERQQGAGLTATLALALRAPGGQGNGLMTDASTY